MPIESSFAGIAYQRMRRRPAMPKRRYVLTMNNKYYLQISLTPSTPGATLKYRWRDTLGEATVFVDYRWAKAIQGLFVGADIHQIGPTRTGLEHAS